MAASKNSTLGHSLQLKNRFDMEVKNWDAENKERGGFKDRVEFSSHFCRRDDDYINGKCL